MLLTYALLQIAAIGGAFAGPSLPFGNRQLPYNQNCWKDGCLGGVIGKPRGSADCQSFFKTTVTPAPITTTSVSSISTGTTTVTTQTSLTTQTITSAIAATTTKTTTVTSTSTVASTVNSAVATTTAFTTSTVTTTTTATVTPTNAGGPNKRNAMAAEVEERGWGWDGGCTETPTWVPTYASSCSGTAAYSSVCSCLGATATTYTAPAPTSTVVKTTTILVVSTSTAKVTSTVSTTVTNRVTQTASSTVTVTSTTTTQTTITGTSTVTSVTTKTSTSTISILATPTCTAIEVGPDSANPDGPYTYGPVYIGFDVLSPTSPARADDATHPPQSTVYPGSQSVCAALTSCAGFTYDLNYFTFDLQFSKSGQDWNCAAYYDYSVGDGSDFNVVNSDVQYSYGYSPQ